MKWGRERRIGVLLCATVALSASCDVEKPLKRPLDAAVEKREDEFRWKERCAMAAERLDKLFAASPGPGGRSATHVSISEVFYSPARNSCICEVSAVGPNGRSGGLTNLLTLYDCLTREDLGDTLIDLNDADAAADAWKRKKDVLKGVPATEPLKNPFPAR